METLLPNPHNNTVTSPHLLVAGLDEAGRGCLAGPVVAAAVILPDSFSLPGLNDSKMLSAHRRELLAPLIKKYAIAWSIGISWQKEIDSINILQASLLAMARAASALKVMPQLLLIDGNKKIPLLTLKKQWRGSHAGSLPEQQTVVHGDRLEPPISAASILAKTWRDRLMSCLDKKWPEYGFARHKGYGVKEHYAALRAYGPCPLHRISFRGVTNDNPALAERLRLNIWPNP